jgi:ankyrin repeat protein
MDGIWDAAEAGDLGEVERLVGQDPGLLEARSLAGVTPLMVASTEGHVEVVRCLLNKGAPVDEQDHRGTTAVACAYTWSRPSVVRLLLERGADPTIAANSGWTPLMLASEICNLKNVRLLLGRPAVKATINHRLRDGTTALWWACNWADSVGVVRALLENGADPTIANDKGITPRAVATKEFLAGTHGFERRRARIAALLEVRSRLPPPSKHLLF